MESEKLLQINKKIAEVKKRILLAEGQKKANTEEWEKKKDANNETITTYKKDIKELTQKLAQLKNPIIRRPARDDNNSNNNNDNNNIKPIFPIGAKNTEDACNIMDLKVIELRKQYDLIHSKYLKRHDYFNKLIEEYRELLSYQSSTLNMDLSGPPPETLEEDANRKLVSHLENEIHRTNVQWMEAEHIRKKYRAIQASLMNDAERFEKSLKELEQALTVQQAEINRLQQVHKDAIEMRDAAKIILQRQEQQAHTSNKARERQASDFRKQVEERKMELERIERTLFATGSGKSGLTHQDSIGSSSGDQLTGKTDQQDDENSQLKGITSEMEEIFKRLMEITGATTPQEVLQRFQSQKESSSRLTYLRSSAETEKKHLENQRDLLTSEMEMSKFSDTKENEVNQEHLESIKLNIENLIEEEQDNLQAIERIENVIKSINETLMEMIFKLQEVDETDITIMTSNKTILAPNLSNFLRNEAVHSDLIDILEEKIARALKLSMGQPNDEHSGDEFIGDNIKTDELYVALSSSSPRAPSLPDEKPQPLPMCYFNLMIGRSGQSVSASPGPAQQPVVTDDENEVPSRNYLKRQAVLIVDSKSRRKGFRPTTQRRK